MDIKSAFLYGKIKEDVYVCQPPRFEDPYFPNRVYKVEKALYGLHQAPRAGMKPLSTYLLDNEFQRGKIDKILFIKRYKGDILMVPVLCGLDIFFGSTRGAMQLHLKILMHEKFVMSSMGESITCTPIETQKPLLKDEDGEELDVHMYRSMIGSLMYLTSSRPDIMFAVCACARYQVNLKVSHLHAVKRIFKSIIGSLIYLTSSRPDIMFAVCVVLRYKLFQSSLIFLAVKKEFLVQGNWTVVANSITRKVFEYVAAFQVAQIGGTKCFGSSESAYLIWGLQEKEVDSNGQNPLLNKECLQNYLQNAFDGVGFNIRLLVLEC
ncbi:putative ribonuclease H-like domain-containing protein [Tanacetum coccineum]